MREIVKAAEWFEGDPHTEAVGAVPSVDPWPIRFYCAKQSNNGTTFVVSPVPLLHLSRLMDEHGVVETVIVDYVSGSPPLTAEANAKA